MVLEIEKWRQKWLSDPTEVTCSYWQRGGSLGQLQSSGYLLNILLPHREERRKQPRKSAGGKGGREILHNQECCPSLVSTMLQQCFMQGSLMRRLCPRTHGSWVITAHSTEPFSLSLRRVSWPMCEMRSKCLGIWELPMSLSLHPLLPGW